MDAALIYAVRNGWEGSGKASRRTLESAARPLHMLGRATSSVVTHSLPVPGLHHVRIYKAETQALAVSGFWHQPQCKLLQNTVPGCVAYTCQAEEFTALRAQPLLLAEGLHDYMVGLRNISAAIRWELLLDINLIVIFRFLSALTALSLQKLR